MLGVCFGFDLLFMFSLYHIYTIVTSKKAKTVSKSTYFGRKVRVLMMETFILVSLYARIQRSSLAWSDRTVLRLHPVQLLLPICILFSCCSPIVSASACCSPIVSASPATPRLCPLQLLLLKCVRLLSRTLSIVHRVRG